MPLTSDVNLYSDKIFVFTHGLIFLNEMYLINIKLNHIEVHGFSVK